MKLKRISYYLLPMVMVLSGCVSTGIAQETVSSTPEPTTLTATPMPTDTLTMTATHLPSPTVIPPTSTATQTPTFTPLPTLEVVQAEETIRSLLQKSGDCPTPCFWGIVPGQTTLSEANDIFTHLGLNIESTTYEGNDFHGVRYDFDTGLSIAVTLTIQDQIVENIRIKITPEDSQPETLRESQVYSPETLIEQYGVPSRVDLALIWGPGTSSYFEMILYFDSANIIVVYEASELIPWQASSLTVCPPAEDFDFIRIWMGKDPINPPYDAVSLEDATDLTVEEFSELMMGEPEKSCIELKEEAFTP